MASEPYEVGSRVQLAHSCHPVPGTVVSYELIRKARAWNPDDHDHYRYAVRWSGHPDETYRYTSGDLEPWEEDHDE